MGIDEFIKSSETNSKVGGYISEIIFNEENKVTVNKNDIVVFVGPNNVGKSQSLKDIFTLCRRKVETKVIKDIVITKNMVNLREYIGKMANVSNNGYHDVYKGYDFNIPDSLDRFDGINKEYAYDEFREVFVVNLTTESRLGIVRPVDAISDGEMFSNPIHFAANDSQKEMWLASNFKKAFNRALTVPNSMGRRNAIYIGERIELTDVQEKVDFKKAINEFNDKILQYDRVDEQGDGIKSFTGILLNLMIDRYCTYLIDEPESFLHPPQAKIMGKLIGETLTDEQQAFISTHSEEIIKGLLEACPDRVKIVRIERNDNINEISELSNDKINEVWKDPILKYSNIMSALFHKNVVLCESDSDCKMYSIINNYLQEKRGMFDETLFIHSGGKHRMDKIVTALKTLNINVRIIVDADILKDENNFSRLLIACGIDWEREIKKKYKIIEANLTNPKNEITVLDFISFFGSEFLDKNKILEDNDIKKINEFLKRESKWSDIKNFGISAFPSGDATKNFKEINDVLLDNNFFIVPVGELENFIKNIGGHGPTWVENVVEQYPDFEDESYDEIKRFIRIVFNIEE